MSEDNKPDAIAKFEESMAEERKFDVLRKETSRNKTVLDHTRTKAQLERQEQDEKDLEVLKTSDFGIQTVEQVTAIQKDNREYIESAKNKMRFIADDIADRIGFNTVVPFFRKNIIFIGAQTGDGKSTTVANVAYHLLRQKNPATKKPARILILTNEERKEDVYNRITCLCRGWHYTNHDKFSEDQIQVFNKNIPILSTRITVLDNVHNGAHGVTTSIEGFEGIMENLIAKGEYYDVILIDYYQNYIVSKRDPTLTEYEVQARLCRMIDKYKNMYPAPFVLLGQINAPDENGNPLFQYRIQGRKLIMTVATCALEMIVDKKHRVTKWKVIKSRFNESIGEEIATGYDKGQFVPYTNEFIAKVEEDLARRANAKLDQNIGIKEVFKEKEEENGGRTEPTEPSKN